MAMTPLGEGREFDLIRAFLASASRREHPLVAHGAGDDCAIIPPFAISTDLSVEDVHFRRAWLQPEEIGYRAAAAALSDLAAVAAEPVAALVSFAFGQDDAVEWATAVMRGVSEAIEACDAVLAGGDVARSERGAVIDIIVIGKTERPLLRSTAQAGDEVYVTGLLGGAAAAVAAWLEGKDPESVARGRYAHPTPRIREALWLREHGDVHAMIDLSDGVAGDARHLAAASGCAVVIDAAALPVHPSASVDQALGGGEDYELCFSVAAGALADLELEFETRFGVPLTRIGSIEEGAGVRILNAADSSGFDHFRADGS